ncbi:hypothetical protein, partial [Vibrio diabolicus]|uniref:hypothetical protein n=1 Tax=Vibrio diabolicus TaxID=50719 RepID=UPI0021507A23
AATFNLAGRSVETTVGIVTVLNVGAGGVGGVVVDGFELDSLPPQAVRLIAQNMAKGVNWEYLISCYS